LSLHSFYPFHSPLCFSQICAILLHSNFHNFASQISVP
jgi:hypothetical protein